MFLHLSTEIITIIWLLILTIRLKKFNNHFMSLLLILEMLSLNSLFVRRFFVKSTGAVVIIFVLITIRVGEAVLGLSILVKFTRQNSRELTLTGVV
jgi:NADH:ubiquinone oxidoreductase subunit K